MRDAVWGNFLDDWGHTTNWSYSYGHIAWAPEPSNMLPFVKSPGTNATTVLRTTSMTLNALSTVYVATIPQMFNIVFMPSTSLTGERSNFFGSNSLIYSYPIAQDLCFPGVGPAKCCGEQAWFTDATLLQCDFDELIMFGDVQLLWRLTKHFRDYQRFHSDYSASMLRGYICIRQGIYHRSDL